MAIDWMDGRPDRSYQLNYANRMDDTFDPGQVELFWQEKWEQAGLFETRLDSDKPKFYTHVMFPYPSGSALHIGHCFNYLPADTYARFKRHQGFEVFAPMGFDAFGLPAENHAIKTGEPPATQIERNIDNMTAQLKRLGCAYDWSKQLTTCNPDYYRWTQWVFLQMYKFGLAERREELVAWDPVDQTTIAREQILPDGTADRSGAKVVMKPMSQWSLRITGSAIAPDSPDDKPRLISETCYAQRLLDDLQGLDWPERTKEMQRNWIGRKTGIRFRQRVKDLGLECDVFDTIPQTFLAQTFTVIAPEHPMVEDLVRGTEQEAEVMEFVDRIRARKAAGRFDIEQDLEGIFTGRYVDNPFGTGDFPIWVASYVLADYGTGIVNCSAHDERDFAFAKKYGIPLKIALLPEDSADIDRIKKFELFYREEDGLLTEPAELAGTRWKDARQPISEYIIRNGLGEETINYKIRDWSMSRQRYWGAPIPIVYDPHGNPHPIPDSMLPWTLPTDVEFKPTGTAPLEQSQELRARVEKNFGKGWTPDFDTMDTFVCSSFYSLRYLAENDQDSFLNGEVEKKWMPVDVYLGGVEHATRHLIYARFVQMALYDMGHVAHSEPYQKLVHQGLIQVDGGKMSKSKGNAVSADEIISEYGADVFRMFLQFLGPYADNADLFSARSSGSSEDQVSADDLPPAEVLARIRKSVDELIQGPFRFSRKLRNFLMDGNKTNAKQDSPELQRALHQTIKKVTSDLESLHFNTALSSLMTLLKECTTAGSITRETAKCFTVLLSPFAPHMAEEIWHRGFGEESFVIDEPWPEHDESQLEVLEIEIPLQINGKKHSMMRVPSAATKDEMQDLALAEAPIRQLVDAGKEVRRTIVVPGKIINVIVQ